MTHVPHELAEEFPQMVERIHQLKTSDSHFRRLFEEYHEVNRQIHHAEAVGVDISDEHMGQLRKTRLALKDELFALLSA